METILFWALAAAYVAALAFLLWVSGKKRGLYALAKGVCSGLFILCAALAWVAGARIRPGEFALLAAALCLCAFGDILLGVANLNKTKVSRKPFVVGALAFSAAHVVFCALFYSRSPFKWYDALLPAVLVCVLFVLERRDAVRLKKMRSMGYIYTFLVGLMAGKAAESVMATGSFFYEGLFIMAGTALFLASDVILLFMYFGTNRSRNLRPANLITYYCGTFLLALSAWWL